MRTKALLGLAALAASALTAAAQGNVYSLNVVGYVNVTVPAGQYKLIANQLVSSDYKVGALLSVPGGTKLFKWTGAGYSINAYDSDFQAWDDEAMTIGPGEATFVQNNSAAPITITFVGEVNQNANTLNITPGFMMGSLFTPQAGLISTDFGYQAPAQEKVYQWTGTGYKIATFDPDFGWDEEPSLSVAEGVFFNSPSTHTWTRTFTVQ